MRGVRVRGPVATIADTVRRTGATQAIIAIPSHAAAVTRAVLSNLAGKLTHKPAGAVKGYVTDTETRGSVSFTVGKDYRFSTTLRLGAGSTPCTPLSGTCCSCATRCPTSLLRSVLCRGPSSVSRSAVPA